MKTFLDFCCSECWHTPENPCDQFIACCTSGPLCHHDDNCKKEYEELNKRLTYQVHDIPVIFIGMGTCGLASGAAKVKAAIEQELKENNIDAVIIPTGCIGYCAKEVIVDIKLPGNDRISYAEVFPKDVPALIKETLVDRNIYKKKLLGTHGIGTSDVPNINSIPFFKHQKKIVLENCGIINPTSIDEYIASGGFKGLDKALRILSPKEVINEVMESGLRGRGGGGFPTYIKWEGALNQKSETKYIICNADEGDPGAFMDRSVLESDPFKLVEGMTIGAYASGASFGYIYCRAEYPLAIERLENTIKLCRQYGLLGKNILNSGFDFDLKV